MLIDWIGGFLAQYPELALYLTVGLGYGIGSIKIGRFSFGPVTGSLLAGILISQISTINIPGVTRSVFFLLFLFGIGYSVGPQFFSAVRGQGAKAATIGILVPIVGLFTVYGVATVIGVDAGYAAGLVTGGLTESTVIGTASDAIRHLTISEAEKDVLISHIIVADAVCYLFGAFGVIWTCSSLGPWLLRIDPKVEAEKLEKELGIERNKPSVVQARRQFELRAYRIPEGSPVVGATVAEAEGRVPDGRIFVHRIKRDGELLSAEPNLQLRAGDVVGVSGRREVLVDVIGSRLEEVDDREVLDVMAESVEVYLTDKRVTEQSLGDLVTAGAEEFRGVYLAKLSRFSAQGRQTVPVAPGITLQRGDILRLVGPEGTVERVAKRIGSLIRPGDPADYIMLGLAIFLGGVFGAMVVIPVGNVSISLGTSVGTLLAGLAVGHLRSSRPTFGYIPDAVVAMMISFGLAAFVAMIGLRAGPVFFAELQREGLKLFLGGIVVTMTPLLVGLFVGRFVLGMNPITLLGALAGAQTMTAGLAALEERSGSPIAVVGYTAAVPFGHVLLTIWGTVIVWLMA